jgi:hypothetical protein
MAEHSISERRAITDSESDLSGSQSMDASAEHARQTQKLNQIIQVIQLQIRRNDRRITKLTCF